jgi:hypothetical protein
MGEYPLGEVRVQTDALPLALRERSRLLPYPVGNPGPAEVVQEAGAPHRSYVGIGQPTPGSGRGGQLGHPARMARGVGIQVYEIRNGAQGGLESCLREEWSGAGLRLEPGFPNRSRLQPLQ